MWEGRRVAVLASGPSLTKEDVDAVAHLPRIVTNATYRMVPDADLIYGSDSKFWTHPEYADAHSMPGRRVSIEQVPGVYPNVPASVSVLRLGGTSGFSGRQDALRTGSNSGYAAIHLAATAGASEIVVLGLDMSGDTHWHGRHPAGLHNPRENSFARWINRFEGLANELQKRGVRVWNCSISSRLECFPKRSLREVLCCSRECMGSATTCTNDR
jgi:hypothetical protein